MPLFHSLQALRLKISLFFWLCGSVVMAQRPAVDSLAYADSLFATGNQPAAARLYERVIADGHVPTDAMLLKLASVHEQEEDIPRLLYYLQIYFDRHPNDGVLRKMNDVARANNLGGYETDDLNYFYLFYRQYGTYFLVLFLLPALYVFTILLLKRARQQSVSARRKWVVFLYLLVLLLIVNLPDGIRSGITNTDRVLLRTDPSAAAPVAGVIGRGNKVNILGTRDIYLRVLWRNELYFIRRDDVWII